MKRDESILQSECVRWFRYQLKDVIFAIPNGGKRDVSTAIRLNHEGVLAGVADLFIMRGVWRFLLTWIIYRNEVGQQQTNG